MQAGDARGWVGDVRRQPFKQAVGPVEAAGTDEAGHEADVLDQEPVSVGDADPGGDGQQLLGLGDAGHADVDGQGDPFGAPCGDPAGDGAGIEAELGRHVARKRGLRAQRREQRPVGDERVALRVPGDPDLGQGMTDLGHLTQQRQAVGVGTGLLGVAADDERPVDAGAFKPGDQVDEVGSVPNHPRRDVRDCPQAVRLELLAQRDRRLDPLRRRGRHRDRCAGRQQRCLIERVLQGDQLERRRLEHPRQRCRLRLRERSAAPKEHGR